MRTGFGSIIALTSGLCTLGCGAAKNTSQLDTVDIPRTEVENQGKIGFCWSYATIGLVESAYKARTSRDINISEEALGIYRLAHVLHEMITTQSGMDLISAFSRPGLIPEGWYTRMPFGTSDKPSAGDNMDALDLLKVYGAVPESVWSFKLPTDATVSQFFSKVRSNGMSLLSSGRDYSKMTIPEIMQTFFTGAIPSLPPTEFDFDGAHYTAKEFLDQYLQFIPDNYVGVTAKSEAEYDAVVAATKRSLARGNSVPMMFPINIYRLHGDLFSDDGLPSNTASDMVAFTANGGHLVLVTDFVNYGGRAGSVSNAELQNELSKPSSDLDFLVFKNSWGKRALTNEAGLPTGQGSETGYYRMDQGYLRAVSKVGQYPGWTILGVVVPKDIAQNPFGTSVSFVP